MDLSTAYVAAFGAATILVLLVVHRIAQRVFDPKTSAKAELLGENHALVLREFGDVFAVFLIGAAVTKNCVRGENLVHDVAWSTAFGLLGLVLLEITGRAGLRLLVSQKLGEALDKGNVAAGFAAGSHYVAMGILTSRAVAGNDLKSIGLALAFFGLAAATHQLEVGLFRALTTYDDSDQIQGENLAAAISYGGLSVAVAIVVARALEGDFTNWASALSGFGMLALTALLLFPIRQLVVQGLLLGARPTLRGGALDEAIGKDRNCGVAALEAASYVGAALALSALA